MKSTVREMLGISLEDLLGAYPSLAGRPLLRRLSAVFLFFPALIFSVRMAGYNADIHASGLREASRRLLRKLYAGVRERGDPPSPLAEGGPGDGGLLLLGNHPGVGDSLALLSLLPEKNLLIVANDRPFFRALPALMPHLILVPEDRGKRTGTLRAMLKNLREGKTVLLYPAGEIEPDPLLHPREPLLGSWSEAVGLLVLLAKKTGFTFDVKPVLIGGVLPASAVGKGPRCEREKRAVGKIIGLGAGKGAVVEVAWGRRMEFGEFDGMNAAEITSSAKREAEREARRIAG